MIAPEQSAADDGCCAQRDEEQPARDRLWGVFASRMSAPQQPPPRQHDQTRSACRAPDESAPRAAAFQMDVSLQPFRQVYKTRQTQREDAEKEHCQIEDRDRQRQQPSEERRPGDRFVFSEEKSRSLEREPAEVERPFQRKRFADEKYR